MFTTRTLRVTTPVADPYAIVTEGRKQDAYRLSVGYACVRWVHTGDEMRGGIVRVNGAGRAVACDCRGWRFNGKCRHAAGTTAMIAEGRLDVPVVEDTRAAMADDRETVRDMAAEMEQRDADYDRFTRIGGK